MRCFSLLITLLLAGGLACAPKSLEAGPTATTLPAATVNLLVMGDWGSNKPSQKAVADAIEKFVRTSGVSYDGMLLAGDNYYVKLTGTADPLWKTLFEDMYDPKTLNFPFYVSFGNHDYQDGKDKIELAYAAENPQSRWKLPSRYYRVDLPKERPIVSILMLDSNKQVMSEAEWKAELDWMKAELSKPRDARWMIAVAHHPLFSNGSHGDNGVMQRDWGSLFSEYKLDMFVCGHDHDLQHLEVPGFSPSMILVGGGGQSVRAMRVDNRGPFSKASFGFGAMTFSPDEMIVRLISKDGEILHTFCRTPDGKTSVLQSVPSDPAVPRTPGSISRDSETTRPSTRPAADD